MDQSCDSRCTPIYEKPDNKNFVVLILHQTAYCLVMNNGKTPVGIICLSQRRKGAKNGKITGMQTGRRSIASPFVFPCRFFAVLCAFASLRENKNYCFGGVASRTIAPSLSLSTRIENFCTLSISLVLKLA